MENNWPTRYGVTLDEIARLIYSVCSKSNWESHGREIGGHVLEVLSRKTLEDPPLFQDKQALMSYARRVARNRLILLYRQSNRLLTSDPLTLDDLAARPSEAERTAISNELREQIFAALKDAQPVHREIVQLHLEGRQQKEIARIIGRSETYICLRFIEAKQIIKLGFSERDWQRD